MWEISDYLLAVALHPVGGAATAAVPAALLGLAIGTFGVERMAPIIAAIAAAAVASVIPEAVYFRFQVYPRGFLTIAAIAAAATNLPIGYFAGRWFTKRTTRPQPAVHGRFPYLAEPTAS